MLICETYKGISYWYNPEKYTFIFDQVSNIPQRLKEIEPEYFVLYNKRTGHFEVHNMLNIGNTYCLTIPYKELDWRAVDLVRMTRVDRMDNIHKVIDRNNQKIKSDAEKKAIDYAGELAKDIFHYAVADQKSVECRLNKKVSRR
jgi:hypothetical protein